MGSLTNVLAGIPGYAGYRGAEQLGQERQMGELQQAGTLVTLQQHLREQEMERAFKADLQGLGPQATQEQLAQVAAKYAKPGDVLKTQQSSLDRQAALDAKAIPKPTSRQRYDGENVIQEELQDGKWIEIGKGPRFAPKADKPDPPSPAVTPVTIQDPKDQNKTIIVDGRTGKKIGDGPKLTETGRFDVGQQQKMRGLGAAIQEAEDLLSGIKRDPEGNPIPGARPTASGAGSLYDSAAGFFGATPAGAAEAEQLKVIAGVLTSKVPRMEGPQSDKDVALYKQMAGDAGNEKLPLDRRLAAVREMKKLYGKYESQNRGDGAGGVPTPVPTPTPVPAPATPGGFQEGQTATNAQGVKIIYKGGVWRPIGGR